MAWTDGTYTVKCSFERGRGFVGRSLVRSLKEASRFARAESQATRDHPAGRCCVHRAPIPNGPRALGAPLRCYKGGKKV